MKHTTTVEVVTKVMTIESREVHQGDMLLEVNQDLGITPWYIRDAQFVMSDHETIQFRMVEMIVNNSNDNDPPEKRRFRDHEKVTVVRIR